ncbi:MAG: hypothetical protein A3I77_06845 [Gammaproteobacteria bacterium RIFCSPLOWO2_02_FULL_42_14]|nr:MAG: hypothetical protein A3B71_02680 [Gammaproteobacteria bacterium RIFCSPHIGHO2_02_FULL_42_43]OGT28772.1 MAG: hypothetical protein A2624_02430 [Gammaproteobacteria bacterium RIFCSPHIGHO2_01_FULL_42_8]OGT51977.1 MAG: hypothetical protein A3E54_04185 [Gammaproteobacteria bacterium RIFCSPHIGHO2_12_FULL_41_25]OGT61082.1 MAG: hypothetical protein A3I77_06845 [Gammaproteobacteria bacterium RIFCSPLOWO2_02_FULL_42_14]OGT87010.1 MAG: hypothetical protein A3G86_00565 [Gammaproteobacteria bacterium R
MSFCRDLRNASVVSVGAFFLAGSIYLSATSETSGEQFGWAAFACGSCTASLLGLKALFCKPETRFFQWCDDNRNDDEAAARAIV